MSFLHYFISPVPKPLRGAVSNIQQHQECSKVKAQEDYLKATPFSSWPEVQAYLQRLEMQAPRAGIRVGQDPETNDWLIGQELLTNGFVVASPSLRRQHVLIEQATTATPWLKHLPLQTMVVGKYVPSHAYRFVFETSGRYAFWMAQWGKAAELVEDGPEYDMLSHLAAWHYYLDAKVQETSIQPECRQDLVHAPEDEPLFEKIYQIYQLLLTRYHQQYQPHREDAQVIELQSLTEQLLPPTLWLSAQDDLGLAMAVALTTVILQISFTTFTRPEALSLHERQEQGTQAFVFETEYLNMTMEMMFGAIAGQCRGIGIGLVFLSPKPLGPEDLVYIQASTQTRIQKVNERTVLRREPLTGETQPYHIYLHSKGG